MQLASSSRYKGTCLGVLKETSNPTEAIYDAATPERLVNAKRFLSKLERLYKVGHGLENMTCWLACHFQSPTFLSALMSLLQKTGNDVLAKRESMLHEQKKRQTRTQKTCWSILGQQYHKADLREWAVCDMAPFHKFLSVGWEIEASGHRWSTLLQSM